MRFVRYTYPAALHIAGAALCLIIALATRCAGQDRIPVERPTALGRALFGPIVYGHPVRQPTMPPPASLQSSTPRQIPPVCQTSGCSDGGFYQRCVPGGGCTLIPGPMPSSGWRTVRVTPLPPQNYSPANPPAQPGGTNAPKIDYDAIVDRVVERVVERIQSDERLRLQLLGPTGPQGPQGPAGEKAVIDYDALIDQVIADLPPVRMAIRRPDGTIRKFERSLGEPIGIDIQEALVTQPPGD